MKGFKGYTLKDKTLEFIESNGFEEPTAIQKAVIPVSLKGKSIIGIAKTGTGKSHAFLIPAMNLIDTNNPFLQVVITAPTRELAIQLYQMARLITKVDPTIKIVEATGGSNRTRLIEQVRNNCHILIGTPGRIKDLVIDQQAVRVDKVKLLVVDEADMTFEFGFLDDVDQVAGKMPKKLQIMVFGATIPEQLQPFIKKYISNALVVNLNENYEPGTIHHYLLACKHRSYSEQLLQILPGINPYVCLIFANTRKEASECANMLRNNDYEVVELRGDLQARERRQALKRLQSQKHSYIVATDLAARGIDIEAITHVISLGFPKELDFYIHRAGRTGRMGKSGSCYALFHQSDIAAINSLKKRGIKFEYVTYRNNQWRILKPRKKSGANDEFEKEIAKIVSKKNQKVKPGYKKKRNEEIQQIKRKKKRQMVRESIAQQRKEKNKQKQREKNQSEM